MQMHRYNYSSLFSCAIYILPKIRSLFVPFYPIQSISSTYKHINLVLVEVLTNIADYKRAATSDSLKTHLAGGRTIVQATGPEHSSNYLFTVISRQC